MRNTKTPGVSLSMRNMSSKAGKKKITWAALNQIPMAPFVLALTVILKVVDSHKTMPDAVHRLDVLFDAKLHQTSEPEMEASSGLTLQAGLQQSQGALVGSRNTENPAMEPQSPVQNDRRASDSPLGGANVHASVMWDASVGTADTMVSTKMMQQSHTGTEESEHAPHHTIALAPSESRRETRLPAELPDAADAGLSEVRRSAVATVALQLELIALSKQAESVMATRPAISQAVDFIQSSLLVNQPLQEPARSSWKGSTVPLCVELLTNPDERDMVSKLTGARAVYQVA